jgi:hypothetical protein
MSPRRTRSYLVRMLAALIGLLIALALAEVGVRWLVPVRNVGPMFSVYDPVAGKRLKPGFTAVRTSPEFRMEFSTNSDGFRGPELVDDWRGRLLFLGDSFTMGYGVSDGEEYPALLAQPTNPLRPPSLQVINAGIGNSGNGRWVKFLRDRAPVVDPALVVMQVAGNDPADNAVEGLFGLDDAGALDERPTPVPRHPLRALQGVVEAVPLLSRSHLFCWLRDGSLRATPRQPVAGEGGGEPARIPLTVAILRAALDQCAAGEWPVLALTVSTSPALEAALGDLFGEYGVPVVQIPSKVERPDLYFAVDAHWNAAGHLEVARQIHAHPLFEELAQPAAGGLRVPAASPLWEHARQQR